MKKTVNNLIILSFALLLLLPALGEWVEVFPEVESTENRAMKGMPAFEMATMDSFPSAFDAYYLDNFPYRNQLLALNSKWNYRMFTLPSKFDKAFIGKSGWMYAIKDEMDLYYGETLADSSQLEHYVKIIEHRSRVLDSINCQYYLAIVPIKTSIYPEYLPFSKSKPGQPTLTDQLVDTISQISDLNLIDLRQSLLEKKLENRLFHKTDNHWNQLGAFYAYEAIMKALKADFPQLQAHSIDEYTIDTLETDGKLLTNLLGIVNEINENDIRCTPVFEKSSIRGEEQGYPVPSYFPYKKKYEQVFHVPGKELKLLVIRDSFGNDIIPYMNEHFQKSVFIFDGWRHRLNREVLETEQPDIYIQLVVESLLTNIPKRALEPASSR